MRVLATVQGVKPLPSSLSAAPPALSLGMRDTAVLLHPSSALLLLPTGQTSLQLYDLAGGRHVAELEVTARNYVAEGQEAGAVTHVVVAPDGSTVVTAEAVLPEEGMGGASTLKFWQHHGGVGRDGGSVPSFQLNTHVSEPHGGAIAALSYSPAMEHVVASASADGTFKLWVRVVGVGKGTALAAEATAEPAPPLCWRCSCTGSFRGAPITSVAFSTDGSLLAAAAGDIVTLWDPASCELLCTLPPLPVKGSTRAKAPLLRRVSFVPQSAFLVAASETTVGVYSLLTATLWWSYHLEVRVLVVNPGAPEFAIAVAEHDGNAGHLLLFDPSSPTPTASYDVAEIEGAAAVYMGPGSALLPSSKGCPLVVLDKERDYVVLDSASDTEGLRKPLALGSPNNVEEVVSAYAAMYGKLPKAADSEEVKEGRTEGLSSSLGFVDIQADRSPQPYSSLLSGPSHVLPSLS
eukprot:SM000140S00611  [mRNA]  locus=s140:185144:187137:+ [translate_table: standard]